MYNITLIAGMDRNGIIGRTKADGTGEIPWHLKDDMKYFQNTTLGQTVVMGHKTYDSLPEKFKPLPKRINVILSRNKSLKIDGCLIVNSVKDIFSLASISREMFVMGGGEVYKLFMPYANRLLITEVNADVKDGDTEFPLIGPEWKARILSVHPAGNGNDFSFSILEYTKR
jgi:dihydrofolate reductase